MLNFGEFAAKRRKIWAINLGNTAAEGGEFFWGIQKTLKKTLRVFTMKIMLKLCTRAQMRPNCTLLNHINLNDHVGNLGFPQKK